MRFDVRAGASALFEKGVRAVAGAAGGGGRLRPWRPRSDGGPRGVVTPAPGSCIARAGARARSAAPRTARGGLRSKCAASCGQPAGMSRCGVVRRGVARQRACERRHPPLPCGQAMARIDAYCMGTQQPSSAQLFGLSHALLRVKPTRRGATRRGAAEVPSAARVLTPRPCPTCCAQRLAGRRAPCCTHTCSSTLSSATQGCVRAPPLWRSRRANGQPRGRR